MDLDRQMYFFYAVPLAPFLVIGIALALGDILGPAPFARGAAYPGGSGAGLHLLAVRPRFLVGSERQTLSLVLVCLYVGLVVANFAWLWPIMTGWPITVGNWQAHLWLPSWR
jgi:dolichyl-phosphate-mannose-protein mannosyltransferase